MSSVTTSLHNSRFFRAPWLLPGTLEGASSADEGNVPGSSLIAVLLASAAGISVLMLAAWAWSVKRQDAGVADVVWGLGFVIVAWLAFFLGEASGPRRLLVPVLVTLWGLRLSGFLAWRNLVAQLHPGGEMNLKEDRRYGAMRRKHGQRFWWVSLLTVFGPRGVLLFVVSLPVVVVQTVKGPTGLGWLDYLGVAILLVGLFFESVGDIQLFDFRQNPGSHGQVLTTGLWRYTRHPNYFGDAAAWWGMFLVAAGSGTGVAMTVLSPLLMTVLLLKVSGLAVVEKGITSRRPRYQEYIENTSAFIPWLPRRPKHAGAVVSVKHARLS